MEFQVNLLPWASVIVVREFSALRESYLRALLSDKAERVNKDDSLGYLPFSLFWPCSTEENMEFFSIIP